MSLHTTRLFVGNLPESTNENELRVAFSVYGKITNLDIKSKPACENEIKKFAFVTLSASDHNNIESCIRHFSSEDFKGNRLYVTRARESFLERLQRERQQTQQKENEKDKQNEILPKKNPIMNLSDKLNPRKRKTDTINSNGYNYIKTKTSETSNVHSGIQNNNADNILSDKDKKKLHSDQKRVEALRKKRLEFKQKQNIIKVGLINTDKTHNKKVVFSDSDEDVRYTKSKNMYVNSDNNEFLPTKKKLLFNNDDNNSEEEVNFEIKEQFEGKKGQKILDLQSRYKSDKRFILDKRFIEDESEEERDNKEEEIDLENADEKSKQLKILQDVLGVDIKTKTSESLDNKKNKPKLGMIRFDPTNPEHAKFLAPVEDKQDLSKKPKKKKSKENLEEMKPAQPSLEEKKVDVSKEQFYKVSETLKETIAEPTTFSLRSLFQANDDSKDIIQEQDTGYISLQALNKSNVKNPLDPGTKNPFVYDSSDSEDEDKNNKTEKQSVVVDSKAVWKENLFFDKFDHRFNEGLEFFNKPNGNCVQKERRELKSLMKKRIYNIERKNQMFQKKIGGRRKSVKNKKFRYKK